MHPFSQEQAMSTIATPVSKPARWTGRVLSGLVILFMLFDGAIKLVPWPVVTETMERIGYGSSETLARSLGVITLACTILYAIPPTSILGAILLTGYLGGAMASHVRIGSPLFSHNPVRILSRTNGLGRALVARPQPAGAAAAALICLTGVHRYGADRVRDRCQQPNSQCCRRAMPPASHG
jgi:DoxX-like family